jgi:hypothetical protein
VWMRENLALPLDLDMLARRAHVPANTHAPVPRGDGSGSHGVAH